jgi:hypothetical protein
VTTTVKAAGAFSTLVRFFARLTDKLRAVFRSLSTRTDPEAALREELRRIREVAA